MREKPVEILALLREVLDPRPPVQLAAGGAFVRDRGLRRVGNPADLEALELALGLAAEGPVRVTAVGVGPSRLDELLRRALAMGAARAVRVWDGELAGADAVADAALLARLLAILEPDLLVTGSVLLDSGDAPAPALAAAALERPCSTGVVQLQLDTNRAQVLRRSDRGARQRVALPLPCAVTVAPGFREPRYPSLDDWLAALDAEIELWGLPELGLPPAAVGAPAVRLPRAGYGFPRPVPLRVPTPDARQPAFERIGALLSGGIQPREGKLNRGDPAEIAGRLFQVLCAEGLVPGGEA